MQMSTAALVAALAVAVGGCSSSSSANSSGRTQPDASHQLSKSAPARSAGGGESGAAQAPDACSLVTDAQVAQVTKVTVQGHQPVDTGYSTHSGCKWTLATTAPGYISNPSLKLETAPNDDLGAGIDVFADSTRDFEPVSGFGEKAATGTNGGIGPVELVVLKNGIVLTIAMQLKNYNDENEQLNEQIAQFAVPKL